MSLSDDLLITLHEELKRNTAVTAEVKEMMTNHIAMTEVRLEGYEDKFEKQDKKHRINSLLWTVLLFVIIGTAGAYWNIAPLRYIGLTFGPLIGGWTIKESIWQ